MGSNFEHTILSGSSNPAFEIVKHIMIDIKNEPEDHLNTPNNWNIYKVPSNLRNLNEGAYTPQLVSIGPIHYGLEKLNPMQMKKLQYLNLFRDRVEKNTEAALDEFKKKLKVEVKDIRQCYAEKLCENIDEDKLVEMMLLDSVFIMELFLRIQAQKSKEEAHSNDAQKSKEYAYSNDAQKSKEDAYSNDVIVKQSWLNKCIQRDLLLLENQIPFSILDDLYNFVPDKKHLTFIELARDYFDCFKPCKDCDSSSNQEAGSSDSNGQPSQNGTSSEKNSSSPMSTQLMKNCGICKTGGSSSSEESGSSDSNDKPTHFTDLIRSLYIGKCTDHHDAKGSPFKAATKLRESGVSFVKITNKTSLTDIHFKNDKFLTWFLCLGCFPKSTCFKARLEIPQLKVDDTTECVLRNLIAFEQCHYPNQPYICNYVSFIDSLIHTKEDVELLVEKGVISHELGSDQEVATLVNSLCKHVVADKTCYKETIKKLNEHERRQWNRTMAALRFVYFRDAWRASSTLVAIAVLVFTIFNFCRVVRLVLDLEAGGSREP